ncbi:HET domain containing protein [Moelleriella libera RCEF 2490]|uniref:HET domain containing protein n=1 Tax=Moelleriella libera RCEF 2490 TaxID=1081109 RepID=A0A166PR23_9HYPO|nr:HET domain containing protein [Moelleriella libera RCEF 2490]
MRLLNVHSLQLENFDGAEQDIPPYAILSHTWDATEILFQDLQIQSLARYGELPQSQKARRCCVQAAMDGFTYVWIDTCCIDKSSSSELSEAINSMFKWYQQSSLCYVYLKDFALPSRYGNTRPAQQQQHRGRLASPVVAAGSTEFFASRWFERGWTLQELIAPRQVVFFDRDWVPFGSRDDALFDAICARTGIQPQVFSARHCMCSSSWLAQYSSTTSLLRNGTCGGCKARDNLPDILDSFHAAVILNWASERSTTRKEDAAYSLIGLFNVNLPLLYGEGDKAFMRLQSAVLARNSDHSLLLWRAKSDQVVWNFRRPGCLSLTPRNFQSMPPIVPQREYYDLDNEMVPRLATGLAEGMEPMEISGFLLRLTVWVCPVNDYPLERRIQDPKTDRGLVLGILNCHLASDYMTRPAILLSHMGAGIYRRIARHSIFLVNPRPGPNNHVAEALSVYYPGSSSSSGTEPPSECPRIDISRCKQKSIRLLVRNSGPSLLRRQRSSISQLSSATDPVCIVVHQHPGLPFRMGCKVLGGYPQIYGPGSCPPTKPLLRSLEKYSCGHGFGLVGGVHLLELDIPANASQSSLDLKVWDTNAPRKLYVIWGFSSGLVTASDEPSAQAQVEMRPWCRLYRAAELAKCSAIPLPKLAHDGLTYQKQMHSWLVKTTTSSEWRVNGRNGPGRAPFPDPIEDSEEDANGIFHLFREAGTSVGLRARLRVAQGFGVTSNDIELTVLTADD